MKNSFWKFMLGITLLSFIFTIILGSEIPWGNLRAACFSWPLAKAILYDISVGIFSSMILVWCIDRIQLKAAEKEEAKRRLILYNKLAPLLSDFYNFFLFLYIATRNRAVEPNSSVLKSLYLCKDEFVKQLLDNEPFYKDGYYGDPQKWETQMNLIRQCGDNQDAAQKIMNMSTSLPWYKCWEIDAEKFYNGVSQIEKDFPEFFSNELLELTDELLNIVNSQKNMVNFVEGTYLPAWAKQQIQISQIPTQMFIDEYKLVDTIRLLDCVMVYIESDSSKDLRSRSLDFFNNRNVCPSIGHSCSVMDGKS